MKKAMITSIAVLSLIGGAATSMAADAKASHKGETKEVKASKVEHMEFTIAGATAANRADIEKLAKEEGAKSASLSVPKGELKISVPEGKTFNKEGFSKKLETLSGVSIKS